MTETPAVPSWPRPYWQAGGDAKAMLQFYVFGAFRPELAIPARNYGSPGLPAGVEIQRFQNAVLRKWEGWPLGGSLGALLREDTPEAFETARLAPDVLVLRGELDDPATLDYLRDTLGVLAGMLDAGASAILDPQILTLFDATHWRRHYLVKGGAPPRHHALILSSEDGGGRHWVHTRGMRKFARPDISLVNVPGVELERAGVLAEKLVELLALGARFDADQPLEVDGLAAPLFARPGGDLDDPRFNNLHVEFRWP